jgi:putative FmdB family regulatory protein
MPTYEYECQACGHRFDVLQKITDEPLTKCPSCHRSRLKRLIGAGLGVIFKGSGFYTTDYKRSGANGSSSRKSESKSDSAPDTGGESKTEGKTASSSEPKKAETKTA